MSDPAPHGFLILDKAPGDSSARAIDPVKKRFGKRTKVGHAGTLDPFATGVLIVMVGDATRLSDLAMALPKTYEATVAFGRSTDSCDTEGRILEEADPGPGAPDDLDERVAEFLGEIQQVPPAFSALKVNGKRAYKLARAGEDVEIAPRRVTVHAIEIMHLAWPEITLRIVCGSGFYVRALGRDLGARLGIPAHLSALRRTAIGPFQADGASEEVRPMEELTAAAGFARVDLDETSALLLAQGRGVSSPEGVTGDQLAVFAPGSLFLCLARVEGELLQAKTVFSHARRALEARSPPATPGASLDRADTN
ncbi:MAG: tRNA pseudouridine(55) synthase TruB [Planctomycetota bacterium]